MIETDYFLLKLVGKLLSILVVATIYVSVCVCIYILYVFTAFICHCHCNTTLYMAGLHVKVSGFVAVFNSSIKGLCF